MDGNHNKNAGSLGEEHWRNTLVSPNAVLSEVIYNLEASGLQIALVVTPEGSLLGTISDGDIRRGLLRGLDMNSSIDAIIHRDPFVVPPQLDRATVLQLMQANKLGQLPVVDENRMIVGLHLWDELMVPRQRANSMIIMAGGLGTRLRPHTENCPKPMLPVGGKPMLEHIIEHARNDGIQHFILAIHYLGHMVEDYFGDGSRWQVTIDYIHEETPLGTAGALSLLAVRPTSPFLVTNGDVLTDIRYSELLDFHCQHGATATMAVRQHEWQNPFGVVHIRGVDIVSFDEKPVTRSHINAGVYVLQPEALDALNRGEHCDMPIMFSRLQERAKRIIVYPMHEPWLDVGRQDDYDKANNVSKA